MVSSKTSGYFRYSPTCNEPKAARARPVDNVKVCGSPKPKHRNAMLNADVNKQKRHQNKNEEHTNSTYKMMNRDFPNALYKNPQFLRNQ